ncbi:hypothetical protein [Ruegeria atlantica]|uniref:hypothetical protein n=1 Tax=Ruegeria atlantica TaxID=81569 RepID=UPI001480BC96|nr:hypothetical protein [Ruegeria atlantica]
MQLEFDFALTPSDLKKSTKRRVRVWLLASDASDGNPLARRTFIRSTNGASALTMHDLVLVKGKGDLFHLYQNEQSEDRSSAATVLNYLSDNSDVGDLILERDPAYKDMLMLSFAAGKRRATGVFGHAREFECRTRFERLLHRLLDDKQVPDAEFAFLIEQSMPYLAHHSHSSTLALFLECYGNFQANASFESRDRDLLEEAAKTRHFTEHCFVASALRVQAHQNRILADSYRAGSAQLHFPEFFPEPPRFRNSGLIVNRVAGFSFSVMAPSGAVERATSEGNGVFSHIGSAVLRWQKLLKFANLNQKASRRIVTRVKRSAHNLSIEVGIQNEFSVFAEAAWQNQEHPASFFTDIWSDDISLEPVETTRDSCGAHIYQGSLSPEVREVKLCVSALLDRDEKRVARYQVRTAVGSSDLFY